MKHFIVESPFLNVLERSEAPLKFCDALQIETPRAMMPLDNLRLAVKDLFHIAGLPTSAGNPTWLATHAIPDQTASSVSSLLQAGAQFCGKTITDELAYSLNGQNIHYGTPENPLTPDRLPGGSSSGSAIAVAKELADIGLGTDTGGSIRVPASYNGLFGLRPTHGVIAMDNMVALAPSFDTVGWLTRDLETLERVAGVLLKHAPAVAFDQVLIAHNLIEHVAHHSEITEQLAHWRAQGLLLGETDIVIDAQAWQTSDTFRTLQGAEIWHQHGDWLFQVTQAAKKPNADKIDLPIFAPDIQARFEWCQTLTAKDIQAAQQQRHNFTHWIEEKLTNAVLMIPTTPGLSPRFDATSDELAAYRNQLMDLTAIAGLAGLPQLHLPTCTLDGAPCGVSLVGPKGSDLALIDFAKHLME
ncbi:amidase [Marinomonas algarum]|uniref:Amidase n=1 Tax=Marinomonas algarum TaxID=2883105 RepID=A0A9X1IMP5_9GAMM|nr:amidase [Marinomonas algarum]MCB5162294.1 amidase [Marinomonas algarum]